MNIRKKLLSILAAAATLAASAAGALTLTAGAAEGVYDSATVVWDVLEHVCGCDMDRCPIPDCAEVKADILHCTTCCAKRLLLSFA